MLSERIEAFEMKVKNIDVELQKLDIPFSKFMSNWLAMVKCSIEITTFGSYQYFIEKRINPYFDKIGYDATKNQDQRHSGVL